MPSLKVGLAPYKTSFYDPKTNIYITLENPVREIIYDANTDLSGICHACMAQHPALVLYEGKFPQEVLDAWKAKYDSIGLQAKVRADQVQANSKEEQVEAQAMMKAAAVEEEVKAAEVKEEEKKTAKKTTKKKKTTTKKESESK